MVRMILVLLLLFSATPVMAEEKEDAAQAHAQKVIDACWAISQEDRDSGVTARMKEGTYKTIDCLHEQITLLSQSILKSDSDKIEFQNALKHMTENAYIIYHDIYNVHKGCTPCGTYAQVAYLGHVATLLEDILKTMLSEAYNSDLIQKE